MLTKKEKTIRESLIEILNDYPLSEEHKIFVKGRISALDKKSSTRKPSASQIKNKTVADELLNFFADNPNTLYTVGELLKKAPCLNSIPDVSHAYANHIVKVLKDNGSIIRTESKGKALFQYNPDFEEVED